MKPKYTYAICYYHIEDEEFCTHHHIHIVAERNIELFKQYCNQRRIIIDRLDTIYADHKLTETFVEYYYSLSKIAIEARQ